MAQRIEPPRYVVDASVAAKWYLRDEHDVEAAERLLTDFAEGRVHLVAPDQVRYEVASAIRNAGRMQRVGDEEARQAIAEFLAWRIQMIGDDALSFAAYDLALRFGCSLYDGLYLALTEAANCPLVYADERLRNASAGSEEVFGNWLPSLKTRVGRRAVRPAAGQSPVITESVA